MVLLITIGALFYHPGSLTLIGRLKNANTTLEYDYDAIADVGAGWAGITAANERTRYMQNHYELVRCTPDESSKQHKASSAPTRIVTVDACLNLKSTPATNTNIHHLKGNNEHHYVELSKNSIPSDPPIIDKSWYEPNANNFRHGYDSNACKPLHKWQSKSFPNCNTFHEITQEKLRMINYGASRVAFETRYHIDTNQEEKFVFKTLLWIKDASERKVEEQRVDALIMERLLGSSYIPDIHGYCGIGMMMDYISDGNMHGKSISDISNVIKMNNLN